jgi:hypothetical protein
MKQEVPQTKLYRNRRWKAIGKKGHLVQQGAEKNKRARGEEERRCSSSMRSTERFKFP